MIIIRTWQMKLHTVLLYTFHSLSLKNMVDFHDKYGEFSWFKREMKQ